MQKHALHCVQAILYRDSSLEVTIFHLVTAFERKFMKSFYTMINLHVCTYQLVITKVDEIVQLTEFFTRNRENNHYALFD